MSLTDLASLGSFISGVAVVVTLIVLILQMRQASRNQRATIHFQRLAMVQDAVLQLSSTPAIAMVQMRGGSGDLSMTPEETFQYLMVTRNTVRLFEEFFYQHKDGMLDSARWANNVRRFRLFSTAPGFRAAWRVDSTSYEADFAAWVETVMADVAASSSPVGQMDAWRARVKAELASAR